MKWYAKLKEGQKVEEVKEEILYSYKTTKDYDQQFYVFNGKRWIPTDVEKFELLHLVD